MATRRSNDSRRTAESTPASPGRTAGSLVANPSTSAAGTRPSRRGAVASKQAPSAAAAPVTVTSDVRRAMIAEAAYLRAERRGFVPGFEDDDWLTAEKEVDALLSGGQGGPQ